MNTFDLLNVIKAKQLYGQFPETIDNIVVDSRLAKAGCVFVASRGYTVDSHTFIPNVIQQGCQMIVSDHYIENLPEDVGLVVVKDTLRVANIFAQYIFDFPSQKLTTYGVTGTNGKTSVATMIHHIHRALNINSAYLGTNGFQYNEDVAKGSNSTPETITLNNHIKDALDKGAKAMAMEMSSHGLALGRTNGVDIDAAIFTNLTQDHLDFHQTMERYGFHKSLLFAQLGNDYHALKYAIVNGDDAYASELMIATSREVITYGIDNACDVRAINIIETIHGIQFDLQSPEGTYHIECPYIGRFNVYNMLAALTAMWTQGHSLEVLANATKHLNPVEGRLEVLDRTLPIDLIIDYAHTPDGMNKLIDAVEPFKRGKLIFLVGMAGERDLTKTPEMGAIACRADYVIFTPDNPANDDPKKLTDALESGATHSNYVSYLDRAEGIRHAIEVSKPDDMVVLASKGREPYQIMPGYVKVPHRDDLIGLEAAYEKYGRDNQ
ncbi:UDP-N-acetylmuramoyl-L-alanyl-D-glutamate--L-lysine ligase [Macrococcoides caseolyticum]|uniref:UDP-N-acetylmuramoyl-L-alanyl-D-glutamate--L- lysine ligase n=1 Tax=Macrococcoides caseolyticum TaxID=69966 RepID=UPI001F342937|nr:UDP-N-acetylmuramoyl-L-alanyl-D-glutamate--L-lysine ligase [Macrococcus caseolyticus]MCE4955707.1 UDP-N-acetylmuramoyl-L-alanyl-D-glutamate--L-lysine ligase [Macrococcus caseolyticus]